MNDSRDESRDVRERRTGEEDRIGTLIRLAGPRPEVPSERADRVKSAVRAHWEAEVGRRAVRRRIWGAVTLAAAASLVVAVALGVWIRSGGNAGPAVVVERAEGNVRMHRSTDGDASPLVPVRAGEPLAVGSLIATDATGRAALRLPSGHSVRLDVGTRVRMESASSLALDCGAVYVDSGPRLTSGVESLEVRTAFGSVRDVGTQFEARVDDASLRLRVREGMVSLERESDTVDVAAGTEIDVDAGGRVRRRQVQSFGPEWAWAGAVAPMMEIQGRSLREFLDWITREGGWRLSFADPALADSASEIRLDGSVQGLTLEQSLDAVLPTCGVTHRFEDGLLIVE